MHIIDICIMKLSSNICNIRDFLTLLNECNAGAIDSMNINGNKFYFPEGLFPIDLSNFPAINEDPDAACTPIICTASGDSYFILSTAGEDFIMQQFSSVLAALLNIGEYYNDTRILDAVFKNGNSVYLIKFNGNSSN